MNHHLQINQNAEQTYHTIRNSIVSAQHRLSVVINSTMVITYWEIGKQCPPILYPRRDHPGIRQRNIILLGSHYKFGEKWLFSVKLHQTLSKAKAWKIEIFRAF